MHPFIAELCVDARRNMLTASYATDALRKIAKRLVKKSLKQSTKTRDLHSDDLKESLSEE